MNTIKLQNDTFIGVSQEMTIFLKVKDYQKNNNISSIALKNLERPVIFFNVNVSNPG
jgi:hypothetical protein